MKNPRYFMNFSSIEDVRDQFQIPEEDIADNEILFAHYGNGSYCGSALVIFQRNNTLYEASGSHCSCNGIEGQWDPSEVTWDQLAMRPNPIDSEYNGHTEANEAFSTLIHSHVPRA